MFAFRARYVCILARPVLRVRQGCENHHFFLRLSSRRAPVADYGKTFARYLVSCCNPPGTQPDEIGTIAQGGAIVCLVLGIFLGNHDKGAQAERFCIGSEGSLKPDFFLLENAFSSDIGKTFPFRKHTSSAEKTIASPPCKLSALFIRYEQTVCAFGSNDITAGTLDPVAPHSSDQIP